MLTKPVVSTTFKWVSKEVAGSADSTIYILAEKELRNEVCYKHIYSYFRTAVEGSKMHDML